MDVDGPARQPGAQFRRQHLHVPGQHHEVDAVRLDQFDQRLLLLGLIGRRDGQVRERDAVALDDGAAVLVVGHNQRDVDGQFLGTPPVQQVQQAVVEPGHHDQHALVSGLVAQ